MIDHGRQVGTSKGSRKIVLVDVSLARRFLHIFGK